MPPPVNWPDGETWMFAERFDEPDLVIKSPPYTMPASAQDVWFRPVVDTGLTEQRWVRAIEIRPSTVEGRRIIHHALARLQQEETDNVSSNIPDETGPGLFMEWAVGKQGELMRPNAGKLMKPGSKIHWDIHIHAVGEEITTQAELAIYFYPKARSRSTGSVSASTTPSPAGRAGWTSRPTRSRCIKGSKSWSRQGGSRTSSRTCTCAARA